MHASMDWAIQPWAAADALACTGNSPTREPGFDEDWDSDASQSLHSVELRSQHPRSEAKAPQRPQQQPQQRQASAGRGNDLISFDSNAGTAPCARTRRPAWTASLHCKIYEPCRSR